MKRLFLFGMICALSLTIGCAHLSIKSEEAPTSDENYELVKILLSIPRPYEYKEDVFDCSNQTAYLYDFLTEKGYKCEIIVGRKSGQRQSHVWLIAEKNGKKFCVDSDRVIVAPLYFKDYIILFRFSSLEGVRNFYRLFGHADEWDY